MFALPPDALAASRLHPAMRLYSIASLLLLIFSAAAPAAEDPLKNVPPAFRDAMLVAMRAFTARDFEAARAAVQKAESSFQRTPVSLNILGAIAIEEGKFDEGRKLCLEALQLDPAFYPARFNLAEIPFVQGKYA